MLVHFPDPVSLKLFKVFLMNLFKLLYNLLQLHGQSSTVVLLLFILSIRFVVFFPVSEMLK